MKLNVLKSLLIGAFIFLLGGVSMAQANTQDKWDKVFAKSNKVEVQKVSFKNRYGITLVGDLYIPKDISNSAKLPAIALSGPFGAVKEQASGFYAQTLAEAGFITLAFDPSYTGESAEANPNLPKNIASPEINTDDFSAAVDFLANHTMVDSEKIGILGICGFGGFALNAAAMDTRIKAIVTSSMYDIPRNAARGYFDKQDSTKDRLAIKESLNTQRTKDFKTNTLTKAPSLPEKLKGDEPQFIKEYWDYYKTKRGFHPNSINSNANWSATSSLALINSQILYYSDEILAPVLVIHGEKAHSRYFSEDAFKKLKGENKELLIVKDANHVDLYDNAEKIPFAKISEFFKENLK